MKNRWFFLFSVLICLTSNLNAQDTIVLKNSSQIIAKISEIGPGGIKYKLQENPDGPDYILEKFKVHEIRFKNGFVQQYNVTEEVPVEQEIEYINDMPVRKRIEIREKRIINDTRVAEQSGPPVRMGQKFNQNKLRYNSALYIPQPGDPYNPSVAGIASFFIPGLGQMLSGEVGRGLGFLGGYMGTSFICMTGMAIAQGDYSYDYDSEFNHSYNRNNAELGFGLFIVGGVAMLGTYIWSIVDAIKVAKVNNMYMQDLRKDQVSIQLKPYMETKKYPGITDRPVGMTLQINF